MNIGIDIDDTITYTYETFLPMFAIRYGMNIEKLFQQNPSYKTLSKIVPDYTDFARDNFTAMTKLLKLRENVVDVLNKLREEGHKIILITARSDSEYGDPYAVVADFLENNGVPYDKIVVNSKNKGKTCLEEKIDLFIDDSVMNCRSAIKYGIPTYQFVSKYIPKGKDLNEVNSWDQVYELVQKMYA